MITDFRKWLKHYLTDFKVPSKRTTSPTMDCSMRFQSELESPLFLTTYYFRLAVLSTISCNVKVPILAIWRQHGRKKT